MFTRTQIRTAVAEGLFNSTVLFDFFLNVPMLGSFMSTVLLSPRACPRALSLRRKSSGQWCENWTCQLWHNAISWAALYLSSPVCCFSINVSALVDNINAKTSCQPQHSTLNSLSPGRPKKKVFNLKYNQYLTMICDTLDRRTGMNNNKIEHKKVSFD